jgi:hypothetical protein
MPENDKIRFHYIKGTYFRVVHVDGVFGGVSPTGDIFASMFSQRPPIPQATVQKVKDGLLGEEIMEERVSKDGFVREMEIGLTMRPEVAETLVKWLQEKLEIYRQMKEKTEQTKK